MNVPNHVAIILDGNGRWAKSKGMPRNYGHVQGAKNVEIICEEAYKMGIKYLTVYAFSTENWNRPDDEVEALMKLLRNYLKTCVKTANKNKMRVRIIGDKTRLDQDLQDSIKELEEMSAKNDGLNFTVALNYGSQDEMLRAMNSIKNDIASGKIENQEITKELFESYLDTAELPDPDLLIRTSGEERLSNFLLWQLAYSEFYFADVHWPDFSKEELEKAVEAFNSRNRRFGKTDEQLSK
ncbi:MAG: isoprenyl transferase [Lachnospiraceae bacterium]|nr:isoprenyl transferase [Lachnospiraceae bacterium]